MANEKTLNTRILLKTGTLAEWQAGKYNKTECLKKGEVAIVTLGTDVETTHPTDATNTHPVLFKIGTGNHYFDALPWASALAADVYDWAKKASLDANDLPEIPGAKLNINVTVSGNGNAITAANWDATTKTLTLTKGETFATKQELEDAVSAINTTTGELKDLNTTNKTNLVAAINEALQAVEVGGTGSVVTVVKDTTSEGSVATYTVKQGGNAVGDKIEIPEMVIASGGTNGSISVNGSDVSVTGLGDAAYTTVDSLNTTAKGYADAVEAKLPTSADYGVLEVGAGNSIEVTGTEQNPVINVKANTFDTYGAAAEVLGTSGDAATANTVYGAKAAAAAAQNDATIAKTKIETFLGTVTPDGSADIIDTLAEINKYVGDHGEEFAELSGKVTVLEGKPGLDKVGTVTSISAGDGLDGGTITETGTIALNAATKASLALADSALQKADIATGSANGTISVEGADVAVKGLGSAAYTDSTAYATADQGGKADTAVQPGDLGTMAKETATDYVKKSDAPGYDDILTATVAGSTYATKNVALGEITFGHTDADTTDSDTSEDVEMLQYTLNDATGNFKTSNTIQTARILKTDTGLKVTKSESNGIAYNTVAIDEDITFIFNCGGAND